LVLCGGGFGAVVADFGGVGGGFGAVVADFGAVVADFGVVCGGFFLDPWFFVHDESISSVDFSVFRGDSVQENCIGVGKFLV
jgi:hypothetical protein